MGNVDPNEQRKLVNVKENSCVLNGTLILHYIKDFAAGEQKPGSFKGSDDYVNSFHHICECVQVYMPLYFIRNTFLVWIPELSLIVGNGMSMLLTHYCARGEIPQFVVLNGLMY